MSAQRLTVRTPDGRDLEVVRHTGTAALALVFHGGTPTAATELPLIAAAAASHGWPVVTWSRPGYAGSTPHPGRSVADVTADTVAVLDHLGVDRFVTLGWSGGGPHALACAALLPARCAAAATLAGVAPYTTSDLDWAAGMGPENVEEFGAAASSSDDLVAFLEPQAAALATVTADEVAAALGGLVADVDRKALTGDLAEMTAAMFRAAVSNGVTGWRDDDLSFVRPWGFELADISVPVAVWQGARDRMVPYAHGQWLTRHIRGARVHLYEDEGHLSLVHQMPRVLDDLAELASG